MLFLKGERERIKRDRMSWFTPQMPYKQGPQLVLGQAEARSWNSVWSSTPWQEPNYLGYYLLPPRMCIIRKLGAKAELGLTLRHSVWDAGISSGILTAVQMPTLLRIFIMNGCWILQMLFLICRCDHVIFLLQSTDVMNYIN